MNIIPKNTAVNDFTRQQSLEVYPNPVSDVLYIKNLPGEQVDYSIFNVLGKMVISGSSNGTIYVSGLDKGLYVLQIRGEKFSKTAKFIVK